MFYYAAMSDIRFTKQQAADIFGGTFAALARALGVSRQAVNAYPDVLTTRQTDSVIGAALRLGKVESREQLVELAANA